MTVDVGVQIVNYGTKRYVQACLPTLAAAFGEAGVSHEIEVLENGSGDDLSDLPAGVRVEVSAVNLGFGAGHNRLAALSESRLICCVNPDTLAPPAEGLARLVALFDDPRVVAAGPSLRGTDGAPQNWDHGELRGLRARVADGAGHAHWRPRSTRAEVAWVAGAFMLLRRAAFAAVDGFDERFFLYKEDEDLCRRLRAAGGAVVYEPAVRVTHVGSVVAGRDPEVMRASRALYNAQHFPRERRRRALEALYLHVTRRL